MNGIDYSSDVKKILDGKDRLRIAYQIALLLKLRLNKLSDLECLDIGCSTGVISNILSKSFKKVIGIDVDSSAINKAINKYKSSHLEFYLMSAENIKYPANSFDVVICNQVYNFVNDPRRMLIEINRVLKPGGVCFFGARNKYTFWDPQYDLPLLSFLPIKVSEMIIRTLGKGEKYHSKYLSYWRVKKLCKDFNIEDYTLDIIKNPRKFGFRKIEKYRFVTNLIPKSFLSSILFLMPNYIWILEKKINQ